MSVIPPDSTIGILGGGQLGRMLAIAAAQLGYRTHIFDPDPSCCAAAVSAQSTAAAFDDRQALTRFAASVDVATYEFENIDVGAVDHVAQTTPLFPSVAALDIAQDRISEKRFAARHGARTAHWAAVGSSADLAGAIGEVGVPSILKTRRSGYDGKGQARLTSPGDADRAWAEIGERPAILEAMVAFDHEFSILIARGRDGQSILWHPPENIHRGGILDTSTVPAHEHIAAQAGEAAALATRIADALDYVGVLAIEFFVGTEGPVFNEMAPRVHNSGHWTIEGAITSQFENHIRAICGLPLGDVGLVTGGARMTNLIGSEVDDWPRLMAEPRAHVHLYDKGRASAGRKMGHVTRLC